MFHKRVSFVEPHMTPIMIEMLNKIRLKSVPKKQTQKNLNNYNKLVTIKEQEDIDKVNNPSNSPKEAESIQNFTLNIEEVQNHFSEIQEYLKKTQRPSLHPPNHLVSPFIL